jgi:hypothetical protein
MLMESQSRTVSRLLLLLLLPAVLYMIPTHGIFHGESLCLVKSLFGVECWGCGMTRAVFSAMYLRFADAWEYNRLVVIVLPLLAAAWGHRVWRLVSQLRSKG